jgi:SAM-dependent methyltransferase
VRQVGARSWRSLPRRALTRSTAGRRLWWRRAIASETEFWAAWLSGAPGTEQWAADREERLHADAPVRDPLVREELERMISRDVSILDVGAGPLTNLGYCFPGKTLTIVPVDPLADEYARLLRRLDLEPPVPTTRVAGEELVEHFRPEQFDIAYSANALDHSADPLLIISNMVTVVRQGGVVILRHKRNEGQSARYGGLHQWNFDVVEGNLVLWNEAHEIDVGAALAGRAATSAWISDSEAVARLEVGGA